MAVGGSGADRLAISRGQARQLLGNTLMKDVSLSTQQRVPLKTCANVLQHKYVWPQGGVENGHSSFKSVGEQAVIPTTTQTDGVAVRPRTQSAAHRHLYWTVLLTTWLTDGSRVFGAGSRPLLVKMVEQVPSCKESRADKLMDNHSRDTVNICVE